MSKIITKTSKKSLVLEEIYRICKSKNNFVFHNNLVKDVCKKVDFGNPFDATKLDSSDKLPQSFKRQQYLSLAFR